MPAFSFFDSFEDYIVESKIGTNNFDMFDQQGGPWQQYLGGTGGYTAVANTFEVTTTRALTGTKSFHVKTDQSDHDAAVAFKGTPGLKCSLIKDDRVLPADVFEFFDGEIISCVQNIYIPSGATNPWLTTAGPAPRVMDIGSRFNTTPQLRVSGDGPDNEISLNRKSFFTDDGSGGPATAVPNIMSEPLTPWPTDRWVKQELRFKVGRLPEDDPVLYPDQGDGPGRGVYAFNPTAPAWVQLVVDDQILIQKTMTSRGGGFVQTTPVNVYEIGVTISGALCEWWIDDCSINDASGPFVEPTGGGGGALNIDSVTPTVTDTETNSLDADMPSPADDGKDFIFAVIADSGFTMGADPALTPIGTQERTTDGSLTMRCFSRRGNSEPVSYNFTAASLQHWNAAVLDVSGGRLSGILDVAAQDSDSTPGDPVNPSVTPTVDDSLVLFFAGMDNIGNIASGDEPTGTDLLFIQDSSGPGGVGLACATMAGTKDVATGTKAWQTTVVDEEWITFSVVLAPELAAAGGAALRLQRAQLPPGFLRIGRGA